MHSRDHTLTAWLLGGRASVPTCKDGNSCRAWCSTSWSVGCIPAGSSTTQAKGLMFEVFVSASLGKSVCYCQTSGEDVGSIVAFDVRKAPDSGGDYFYCSRSCTSVTSLIRL